MAAARKKTGLPATLLLLTLWGAPLLIAPSLIRGLAASAWVAHYSSLKVLPRPHKAVSRVISEKADLAIQNLAPLPQSSAAAILALELGQRMQNQDHDPEAALIIYQGVRASCVSVRSRPLSGAGFAVIESRAAVLEDSARRELPEKSGAAK